MSSPTKFQSTFAILLATFMWGVTFALIKDAVDTLPALEFVMLRFGIAALLLFLFFFKKIHFRHPELMLKGFILGIFLGGTVIFQTIGLQYTSASTAGFIAGLSVVLVTIFTFILDKKYPTPHAVLAVMLTIIGLGFITFSHGFYINRGDIWVIMCEFCFAIYIILSGKFSQLNETLTLTFYQLFTIFIITFFACLINQTVVFPTQLNVWGAILFCSIFASILAFFLQLKFQQYVSVNQTAIIFAAEPVFATIIAILYLHEHITLSFVVGAILICSAIILSEKQNAT